jgi:hypothetical protein
MPDAQATPQAATHPLPVDGAVTDPRLRLPDWFTRRPDWASIVHRLGPGAATSGPARTEQGLEVALILAELDWTVRWVNGRGEYAACEPPNYEPETCTISVDNHTMLHSKVCKTVGTTLFHQLRRANGVPERHERDGGAGRPYVDGPTAQSPRDVFRVRHGLAVAAAESSQ